MSKAPKEPATKRSAPAAGQKRQSAVVQKLIEQMESKLSEDGVKASLGDYIKLMQLQKELEASEAKEIRVSWVEKVEEKTESDTGE